MKTLTYINIIILLWYCDSPKKIRNEQIKDQSIQLIGTLDLTKEVAGSNYIKSATQYFVIDKNDTSNFTPLFSESLNGGEIALKLNLSYIQKNTSHSQRMDELIKILSKASSQYNIDSLQSISVGRLIQTGDLAINIANQYTDAYDDSTQIKTTDYKILSNFLLTTKLTSDFNDLLEPYALSVKSIDIEKAFFSDKATLFNYSELETDSLLVPDKILDCITWLTLEKN